MSTFRVTIEKLTIHPHNNADALELAQVGLYRAVVAKGVYTTGDYALYVPEGAIIPDPLIEELGLTGKLAGKARNRVKAIRLRGELSQGIVCRPAKLAGMDYVHAHELGGGDFAQELGIEKWVPEIPPHMAGEVAAAPELVRWVDIENLQRYPDIFTDGEPVVATEKIHGTCCLVTYDAIDDRLWVSSKGHGSKSLALVDSPTNLYWRAVRAHGLREALARLAMAHAAERVAVFGEVYGKGVQDLAYGANAGRDATLGFRAFDIKIAEGDQGERWLSPETFEAMCRMCDIPAVPVLYRGPFELGALNAAASGQTVVDEGSNIREGIVIRPAVERHSDVLGGRAIAKLVSPDYLTRKGDTTEYE